MQLPQQVTEVLSKLRETTPAYVVGGAVRDYLRNKPINDYDIHVEHLGCQTAEAGALLTDLGWTFKFLKSYGSTGCFKATKDGVEIDLIVSGVPVFSFLDTFPVGICKVILGLNGVIIQHPDYTSERATKHLIFTRESSEAWENKIIAKFPEWTYERTYEGGDDDYEPCSALINALRGQ